MTPRAFLRSLVPPLALDLFRQWTGRGLRFGGQPADWAQARQMSGGYDAAAILERVRRATRAVERGEAVFERDGVLLDAPEVPFAVLTALLQATVAQPAGLDVVDFGGSLGSTYRQCRPFLQGLVPLRWWVVEQEAFVHAGQAEFQGEELRFVASAAEIPPPTGAQVVVLSSVLQYLEDPEAVLSTLTALPATCMVIDRTPMSEASEDVLCVQRVPASLGAASYPCRILSRQHLITTLASAWREVCGFACSEGERRTDEGLAFAYRGMILTRRHDAKD